jgi:hypothetical protein
MLPTALPANKLAVYYIRITNRFAYHRFARQGKSSGPYKQSNKRQGTSCLKQLNEKIRISRRK